MSDKFRKLQARVEANYQILASGLRMVRQEMHEGQARQQETMQAVQETMQALQESLARLAQQQHATARRLETNMDSLIEAVDRTQTDLRDSLGVMATQFDTVDDLRNRVEALEDWKRHQTG